MPEVTGERALNLMLKGRAPSRFLFSRSHGVDGAWTTGLQMGLVPTSAEGECVGMATSTLRHPISLCYVQWLGKPHSA